MICKWFSSFNIALFFFLLLGKTSSDQGCDSNGINCISCTDYQICNEGISTERIISCESENACADDELKKCQMKLNCYALNECLQAGIFPDPMVDSNYFVCLSDGGAGFLKYDFSCEDGNFFDKSVLSCFPRSITSSLPTTPSSSTSTSTSSSSTSTSTSSSSTSTSTSSTSISTSTSTSTPSTSISTSTSTSTPSTSISTSTSTSTSTPSTSISTSTSTSTSTSSTSISTSTSTSTSTSSTSISTSTSTSQIPTFPSTLPTTPSPIPENPCTGPGIFPYPDNCKMYYRCSSSLKAFVYICPGNSYFNENVLKCSMIITPACKEQILKNSTSTLPLIVTPTTPKLTTTTTPKPTTTTPITTTTPKPTTMSPTTTTIITTVTTRQPPPSPTTTPPFSCPMSGVFENPSDCKTYYKCSISGKAFRYVCPGATYFNEITKRCSLIVTPRCKSLIQG